MPTRLRTFDWRGKALAIHFVETVRVKDGVECDVYQFEGDTSRDLGIIAVAPKHATPLQRVLLGERTIEGYIGGSGVLTITPKNGDPSNYEYPDNAAPREVEVGIGATMQWHADAEPLTFYEICEPPYADGRYENLSD